MLTDINTSEDIEKLVKTFYANLLQHDSVKPVFANIDFEAHLPHMIAFWEFVLLDKEGYKTNVFDKHMHLPLTENMFEIWLNTFEKTAHHLFKGEVCEKAIFRAQTIAFSFQHKLKQMGKLG